MNNLTLETIQAQVDTWIKTVGVRYFSELTNMAILTEEVGEVARLIARMHGDQSFRSGSELDAETQKKVLADELNDVLFVVVCLANQHNISLEDAFIRGMEKRNGRDANRHLNNPKLHDETCSNT